MRTRFRKTRWCLIWLIGVFLGSDAAWAISDEKVEEMGRESFRAIKAQTPPASDPAAIRYVNCVADAIIRELDGEDGDPKNWEVVVFDDTLANAFALPGRKIGVYTGLFQVADGQDQLGAVMGHEVAHVLAEHPKERLAAAGLTSIGTQLLQILGTAAVPEARQLMGLLGMGAEVGVMLPFNRGQESEADIIGIDLMAEAGFDPRQSVALWQNMSRRGAMSGRPPAFLSTHPSSDTRMEDLEGRMDAAMDMFMQARMNGKKPRCSQY